MNFSNTVAFNAERREFAMNTNSSLYRELSQKEILAIVESNFNSNRLQESVLLEGGLFNTTYKITFGQDCRSAVLRCGPVNRDLLMAFEEKLMQAENCVYKLCENAGIPCSKVLVCDTIRKIIDRDYMIIEYINSIPLSDNSISKDEKSGLYFQVGKYMKQFHSITNPVFGRVSYLVSGISFSTWYDYLIFEIYDITEKSRKFHAFTEDEIVFIQSVFEKHKALLNEITAPHLVHTDLWEGNVLVHKENGILTVAAIIDADRALFGDVDFEFASPWMINKDFLRGYDMNFDSTDFNSEGRKTRRKIYLILYYMIEAYVGIAEYNNEKQFQENKKLVLNLSSELI